MPNPPAPRPDMVITDFAAHQHGVVSRSQLLGAGLPEHAIDYRVEHGRLTVVHRGVYRVGPSGMPHAREMAALLACGPEALLCHRSAGLLWDLLGSGRKGRGSRKGGRVVDVCVPRNRPVRRRGIRGHRLGPLPPDETTLRHGLRVTTPARTLLDLAGSMAENALERAVARAGRGALADHDDLLKLMGRYPRTMGIARLRAVLDVEGGPALTRSEAESRLLDLIRRAKLPTPETNVRIAGLEVDFLWPAERLVLEMDGFEYHASRAAFEWDRERDALIASAGMRFVRVTWRQLVEEPEAVVARVGRSLGARAQGPGRRRGS